MKINSRGSSDGNQSFNETLGKLNKTCEDIGTCEARVWLIDQLLRKNLSTRDVYSFAIKQARLRVFNREPDAQTIKHAMHAKRRDTRKTLADLKSIRTKMETQLLTDLEGKKYKWRKLIKKCREKGRQFRERKLGEYERKIKHYEKNR